MVPTRFSTCQHDRPARLTLRATPREPVRSICATKRLHATRFDAIFNDPGPILGPIFVAFRGCITRASRLAARRAKPLFLLAGAVLSRGRRLCNNAENRRKSMAHRSDDASRTRRARKTRFFRSRVRLGIDFGHLGALPVVPGHSFWRPGVSLGTLWRLPGRAGETSRHSRDDTRTSLGTSGRPVRVARPILDRFWVPRRAQIDQPARPAHRASLTSQSCQLDQPDRPANRASSTRDAAGGRCCRMIVLQDDDAAG